MKSKVSIIIRTCGRPNVLRKALESVKKQTYRNIEVIVVEDGPNISENMVYNDFSSLNILYFSTGQHVGRTKSGNIGLRNTTGSYINFLDDDDILLENHITKLADYLDHHNTAAVYAIAEEHQVKITDSNLYNFKVKRRLIRYKHPYNKLLLFYLNYIPIQAIMFRKELYNELGGFDENLDVLEDWDLWINYSTKFDFVFYPEITSIYYTPYKGQTNIERAKKLKSAESLIKNKYESHMIKLTFYQINTDMEYILNNFNQKSFWFYMKKLRNLILYRDR